MKRFCHTLIVPLSQLIVVAPSPALIINYPQLVALTPSPANIFPNTLAPNVPDNNNNNNNNNNTIIIPVFYFFASFSFISLASFIIKPKSSRGLALTVFMIYSIPSLEFFFWIAPSVADAAAVNPNDLSKLLAIMV